VAAFTVDANVWFAALQPRDKHHFASVAFLRRLFVGGHSAVAPELLLVELASALSRRYEDPQAGIDGLRQVSSQESLLLDPLSGPRLVRAAALGAQFRLRGADAIYAATADSLKAPLISWDVELCSRAGAITPAQFLDEESQTQLDI
jgi:predicted nucleic acid-binding protein